MVTTAQPPTRPAVQQLFVHNSQVLRAIKTELYEGYEPARDISIKVLTPSDLTFKWLGGKIPFKVWSELCCFLRWTQEEFKEEAMVTLFYHPVTREWRAWAFPQEPVGMTIKLLPQLELYKEDRKQFGEGWIQAGSVHHHCNSAAFASGTDTNDEMDRDGVHITLGKMLEDIMDIHVRHVFDGVCGISQIRDWVELPDYVKQLPEYMQRGLIELSFKGVKGEPFPEVWKERILEMEKPAGYVGGHNPSFPGAGNFQRGTQTTSAAEDRVPAKTTILTKDDAAKERNTSRTNKRSSTTTGGINTETVWAKTATEIINTTLTNLSITPMDAYALLTENNPLKLSEQDKILRHELRMTLTKNSVALLYAETLLENML